MKTYKVGDECPGCNEYRCPRELIEAQSEIARLRAVLEAISALDAYEQMKLCAAQMADDALEDR